MFTVMHNINSFSNSLRFLNYIRTIKLSYYRLKCPIVFENSKLLYCSVQRIICTDTRHQTHSQVHYNPDLTAPEQETLCFYSPFLKENFNITDNRYFKLISDSNYCLEDVLRKEEFKEILSRSHFTFDVELSHLTNNDNFEMSEISICSAENSYENSNMDFMIQSPSRSLGTTIWCSKTPEKENDDSKPTEAQLLQVIDRLTFSLLNFFEKPHDFTMYHKNIVFHNNIRGITIRGLTAYIQAMYIFKIYGLFHYAKVKVEILKITHHIEDGTIRVRWRVNGVSRHQLFMNIWKLRKFEIPRYIQEGSEWLDGFSIFSVDMNGLIFKHVCDKLTPDHEMSKSKKSLKSKLIGLIQSTQRTPAGSLQALMMCYKNSFIPNCKKIT